MNGWYVAYLISIFVFGSTLADNDIRPNSFSFWILTACIIIAHITGWKR